MESATEDGEMEMPREEVERIFCEAICRHACPSCDRLFTEAAVAWGNAWREGYDDRVREEGQDLRDGPFKLSCASCGARAWYNVFANRVRAVGERS